MESHWACYIIVEWNELSFIRCVSNSLGSWMLYHFRVRRSLSGWTSVYVQFWMRQRQSFNITIWSNACIVNCFFLGFTSWYGVDQVSLSSILSGTSLCHLCCTRSVQFGFIVPSLINRAEENSSSNTKWNWGKTWPVSGFRTRANDPAWNGSDQERSPHMSRVPNWVVWLCCLATFLPRHKMYRPIHDYY